MRKVLTRLTHLKELTIILSTILKIIKRLVMGSTHKKWSWFPNIESSTILHNIFATVWFWPKFHQFSSYVLRHTSGQNAHCYSKIEVDNKESHYHVIFTLDYMYYQTVKLSPKRWTPFHFSKARKRTNHDQNVYCYGHTREKILILQTIILLL